MIAIADSFDAMSSTRRYRANKTHEDAILELQRCSGTQFDTKMVEEFIKMIEDWDKIEDELKHLD
jgi:HD-GYP domain-containing protein (c-di-GMP phosphodiesterase class II)